MRIVRLAPLLLWVVGMVSCKDGVSEAPDGPNPECSDGIDNDNDGLTDYPDDPGCSSPSDMTEDSFAPPACSDGKDNDGDGKTDFPNDPGCLAPQQDSEADDCPAGPNCPQCGNGIDDDGNGMIDYPADPGCSSASDDDEFTLNPAACGTTVAIQQLPPSMLATGSLDINMGSITGITDTCGEVPTANYAAAVYELILPVAKVVTVSTAGSAADTVVDIRKMPCIGDDQVLACSDDITATNHSSSVTTSLTAGHYLILVAGKTTGSYKLRVTLFAGQGATCFMPTDCGPGLVCRVALGDTATTCEPHVCSDGVDDDGDGKNDYPDDPGCASPQDDDESDTCPSGATCPQCANGIDDDGDGHIDYPADPSCTSASSISESCTSLDGVQPILASATAGDTTSATDDYQPSCMSTGGKDLVYSLDLPAMKDLSIGVTGGFEPGIALLDATCGTDHTELGCQEFESPINLTNLAAGQYFIDVDSSEGAGEQGPFSLTVSGHIRGGGSCEGDLFAAGVITCAGSSVCSGTPGSRVCFAECSDGIDNNGDGRIDYPNDPGCDSPDDGMENTVCPGATCPQCADGIDNDGDGQIDYPADTSCISASGVSESCQTTEGVTAITTTTTSGDTSTATDDFAATCAFSSGGQDLMYSLTVPALKSLNVTINESSFEAAFTIFDATCGADGVQIGACIEDFFGTQTFSLANLPASSYFIDIDGVDSFDSGPFTISVAGTIAAGQSCESPLVAAGVLTCEGGLACAGTPGSRICFSACADGVDNDGDGKIDYPNDPGCTSPADNDETDTCPAGPTCPQCGNGIDDDGDGHIDYPADSNCQSASGMSESFCSVDPDLGGVITTHTTSGNNSTGNQTFTSCASLASGNDELFELDLPVALSSLEVDTFTSPIDTVLSIYDSTCSTALVCDDDSSMGLTSQVTLNTVAAGTYGISVEAYQLAGGAFVVNVSGVAVAGAACTSPLFANGVLSCAVGQTCTAGLCQ